jgi:uncharacterized iron-regulated protein
MEENTMKNKEVALTMTRRLMRSLHRPWLPFLLAAALTGCATQPTTPPAQILLLGEVHDNPDGHQQRYVYLRHLIQGGWRPVIVMEQFDRESQALLTKAQAECADADCVIRSAGGKRWEWQYYRPVIELALRYRLPLIAANVSRADAVRVMTLGVRAALNPQTMAAFRLQDSPPADLLQGQRLAIESGHCGKAPESMVQGMVNAQIARDVWMAQALRDNARTGAVLIAGNGHVRRDMGVPRWLAAVDVKSVRTHGFVEQGSALEELAYDVTHPIALHQRPDPCGALVLPSQPTP